MTVSRIAQGIASLLVASAAFACEAPSGPEPGSSSLLVYDTARQEVVLIQSERELNAETSTWTWDGRRWRDVTPAASPTGLGVMVYDPVSETTIYVPESGAATWAWDGAGWSVVGEAFRGYGSGAYDPARRRIVVLFATGGTLEWDGGAWQASSGWSGGGKLAIAYDTAGDRMVATGYSDQAWERIGTKWQELEGSRRPPTPYEGAMVYDQARERLVLFGGDETWEWDGARWQDLSPAESPASRLSPGMAYDSVREKVVLFGSINGGNDSDVWEWDGRFWLRVD